MSDIYAQHGSAFGNVSAFVIAKDGKRVATIAFKFGNAVTAYVHWLGPRMVRGVAKGGGYDRKSAACSAAADKLAGAWAIHVDEWRKLAMSHPIGDDMPADMQAFRDALDDRDGACWNDRLRNAGFGVWQAV
jgi:hypothetical protein